MLPKTEVLIVGAGPVGLFMANELNRHGISCRIIDKKESLSVHSKALGLHIRTLEVFAQTGFIEPILSQGHPVYGALFKSKGKTIIDISFEHVNAPFHALIDLPQDQTEAILAEGLKKRGLPVEWQTELTAMTQNATGVAATVQKANGTTEVINADWAIACDGAHSTLRHLCNMDFVGSAYKEHWWLADVYIDWHLPEDRMIVFLTEQGPIACFPMNKHRYRLVMLAPKTGPLDPNFEQIQAYFAKMCSEPATLRDPLWISGFNIHHRQIQDYRQQRIFFAGDAAHIHSPIGGQGLNTGIQDAYNLAWKLALVQKQLAAPKLLDTYHLERFRVGQQVVHDTDRMTKMFLLQNPLAMELRNHFVAFITSFDSIKAKLTKNIAELTVHYQDSPIVKQQGHFAIKAGSLLPYAKLTANNGSSVSLQELALGTTHHLLVFTANASPNNDLLLLAETLQDYTDTISLHLISGPKDVTPTWPGLTWHDPELLLHQHFGIKQASIVLIRPDQYIAYLQDSITADALLSYLEQIFVRRNKIG